jgi:NAD(P)-dependent dehydrogenase (short-subunit alcohol dehydrogenase family)
VHDIISSLHGQGAVVVGGATVAGRQVVDGLRRAGCAVVVVDAEPSGSLYADLGGVEQPAFVKADIRHPDHIEGAFQQVDEHLDTIAALVTLVDATGEQQPSEDLAGREWQDVLDLKLNGVFWSCQQAARRMLAAGTGSIVNVSSLAGVLIDKHDRRVHYHAANSAVNTLTKGLAVEWGSRGVRVNAVAPGALRTAGGAGTYLDDEQRIVAAVPLQRLGTLDEIVPLILFLCSDASSYVTGQTLVADGGRGLLFD